MPETDTAPSATMTEARRVMEICNACRYCEGFCAVFPTMALHRDFANADLNHLANLCHNCKACYHACQYAPPHPFGVNVPQTFAVLRDESYQAYAWPRPLAAAFARNGTFVALTTGLGLALVLILTDALTAPGTLTHSWNGPDAFYRVIPWAVMSAVAAVTLFFSLLALTVGSMAFWREIRPKRPITGRAVLRGLHDAMTLKNLGGGGHGCNDRDGAFSTLRRRFHHAMAYGFAACFAATSVAAFEAYALGLPAPYPWLSAPVILGVIGGVGLLVGTSGLIGLKFTTDPAPTAPALLGADLALLALLWLAAATGLTLLVFRTTAAMGPLLALHLGFILALFVLLPYSKFVHAIYRTLALISR